MLARMYGCDHTSTNAPDPIRTPKLSVLGESSTRMGDLLGSPRVAPVFLSFYERNESFLLSVSFLAFFVKGNA